MVAKYNQTLTYLPRVSELNVTDYAIYFAACLLRCALLCLYETVPLSLALTKFSHSLNHCMLIHRMTVGASSAWNSLFNYRRRERKRETEIWIWGLSYSLEPIGAFHHLTELYCIAIKLLYFTLMCPLQTWWVSNKNSRYSKALKYVWFKASDASHRCCTSDKNPVQITFLICPACSLCFISSLAFTSTKHIQEQYAPFKRSFQTMLHKNAVALRT